MATPVHIKGGPTNRVARVTPLGQLVTAPFGYDETVFKELATANTAYNFYQPKSGQQFVITGIRAKADRDVSNTADAEVVIYEAGSDSATAVDKTLHQEAMIRGESITLIPVNILVAAGKYVNAKTTDDDIHMTIFGYYVPVL
jgi:hypothetical protein